MGTLVFDYLPDTRADLASSVKPDRDPVTYNWLMVTAPLVFATLVGGIAHMGS